MSQVSSKPEKTSGKITSGNADEFSAEFQELLQPAERQQQVIWLSFLGSILALVAAGAIIAPTDSAFTLKNESSGSNLALFHFIGIGLGVFSLLVRTYTYSDRRIAAILQSRRIRVPHQISDRFEISLWRLFVAIRPVQLLGWVINDLIMVTGLIAVIVGQHLPAAYPFVFIAVVLQALSFPRFRPMAARARKLWSEYQLDQSGAGL